MVTWGADAPAANIGETKATNRNTWRKTFPGKGITNTLLGPLRNRFKTDEYNSHRLIWSPGVGRAPPPAAFDFGSRRFVERLRRDQPSGQDQLQKRRARAPALHEFQLSFPLCLRTHIAAGSSPSKDSMAAARARNWKSWQGCSVPKAR